MTGTGARNQRLGTCRIIIQKKMFVRCVRIEADRGRTQWPRRHWDMPAQQSDGLLDLVRRNLPANFVGRSCLTLMVNGDLDPVTQIGEPIEISAGLVFPNEDREALGKEQLRVLP